MIEERVQTNIALRTKVHTHTRRKNPMRKKLITMARAGGERAALITAKAVFIKARSNRAAQIKVDPAIVTVAPSALLKR